jgi:hypothetical protein
MFNLPFFSIYMNCLVILSHFFIHYGIFSCRGPLYMNVSLLLLTSKVFFFQGRLAEFGPPALLLDSNGIFASMARSAGITVPHQ